MHPPPVPTLVPQRAVGTRGQQGDWGKRAAAGRSGGGLAVNESRRGRNSSTRRAQHRDATTSDRMKRHVTVAPTAPPAEQRLTIRYEMLL